MTTANATLTSEAASLLYSLIDYLQTRKKLCVVVASDLVPTYQVLVQIIKLHVVLPHFVAEMLIALERQVKTDDCVAVTCSLNFVSVFPRLFNSFFLGYTPLEIFRILTL